MTKPAVSTFLRPTFALICLILLFFGTRQVSLPTPLTRNPVHVLCYHDITPAPANRFGRTPTQLDKDFAMLQVEGLRVVPLDTIVTYLQSKRALPSNWVAITFDDASKGQYDFARPLLKKYAFPATFYVPTKSVESIIPVSTDYSGVMRWQDLLTLKEEGFSLESHSHTHHSYARMTTPQLENDIATSLQILQNKLEVRSTSLCLPYGEYLPKNEPSFVKMAIQSISLTTTDHGRGNDSLVKIHRFEVKATTSQEKILAIIGHNVTK